MRRLIALLAVLGCPSAWAGEGFYMGIEGGGNVARPQDLRQDGLASGELSFEAGFVGGLVFGFVTPIGLRPELELAYRRNGLKEFSSVLGPEVRASGSLEASAAMANLWWDLGDRHAVVHPYFGVGVGGARVSYKDPQFSALPASDDDRTLFAYQGGAGLGFDFGLVGFSMDYRYLQTNVGEFELDPGPPVSARYRSHTGMATLRFWFGGGTGGDDAKVAAAKPKPRLPAAPVDADGDGLPDDVDKCPGTPPGFRVDVTGCITQQTVVLRAVEFQFGSADLTAPTRRTLDPIADALRNQPALRIEVQGHTDSAGSPANNLKLSQRRADAVARYLVSKGVPRENLTAKGYGHKKPIADNATEEGRARNRRVQFVVLSAPAPAPAAGTPSADR